jgi:hypothetical protein
MAKVAPRHTSTTASPTGSQPVARSAAPTAPLPPRASAGGTIRVRAIALGYYDDKRRRIDDVFDLHPRKGVFSEQIIDEKTGKPELTEGMLLASPVTREVKKTITAEEQFSPRWMEKVDARTPLKVTTGNEALRQQHDEIVKAKQRDAEAGGPDHPTDTNVDVLE